MSLDSISVAVRLVACTLVAVSTYYSWCAIYNLFFSPIAHVPGPFWSKISLIPSLYHAIKGDRHAWLGQNFETYGDTVRIGPDDIVFKSATAFRDIYNAKANVTRANSYSTFARNKDNINTINTSDVQIHRNKRRLLNLAFTEKSLRSAESFIIAHVDRWNELLAGDISKHDEWLASVNIAEWADRLAFDIMGDLSFGQQFNTKEPGKNHFRSVSNTIHEYMTLSYEIMKSPLIPFLVWAKPRGMDRILEAMAPPAIKEYFNFLEKSVKGRQKALREAKEKGLPHMGAREDLFHYLCEAKHPDHGGPAYTNQELLAEANLLVIAGSDTTSIALSSLFFYITRNQRCYARVIAEIRDTFAAAEDIRQGPQLASCTYLRACIDESLRLTPPVPSELPRLVLPGGQLVEGRHYPAGVHVGTSMWCTARHEDLGDPLVYRPERWIVDAAAGVTEHDVRRARSFTQPFSAGLSNCVGQNLGMLELLVTAGRTLWRLDVRKAPGSVLGEGNSSLGWGQTDPGQYVFRDSFVASCTGPLVQFRRRKM